MAATVRNTTVDVTVGGSGVSHITTLRWSTGFDLQVGEAAVVCATDPGGSFGDSCEISVNGTSRWRGVLVQKDWNLYPLQVTLVMRDPMYKAQEFVPPDELQDGMLLADITGGPATDQDIVAAVLGIAGVSDVGGIGGTSTVMGSQAVEEFTWRRNETALSYISRIDSISLGYRTYFNGAFVVRTPINISSGSSSYSFTEGEDIRSGTSNITALGTYNAVRVGGWDVGDYDDPRVTYLGAEGSSAKVFNFESKMIERKRTTDPGEGMTTDEVADYWLGELDRGQLYKVTMTTPRVDLFLPGQAHTINGSDRLGLSQSLWVQRVDGEVAADGSVSHTMQYIT